MDLRLFQQGFNFSQDGPGNRLVLHLQGCNLRCPWCSNPEGLAIEGGNSKSVDALVTEIVSCKPMFFDGGGVTLTGGEVTLQLPAVQTLLSRLNTEGIHTCIETNGLHPRLPELFPFINYLIMDVKHHNGTIHERVTGLPCTQVYSNLTAAMDFGLRPALRIPLIGGFNASLEDAVAFADLFDRLKIQGRATVELLPYHEYGKDKYAKLGLPYTMSETASVSPSLVQEYQHILEARGFLLIKS